jgi:hypothetical protein
VAQVVLVVSHATTLNLVQMENAFAPGAWMVLSNANLVQPQANAEKTLKDVKVACTEKPV